MQEHLAQLGYGLDPHAHIWRRPRYEGLAYSDGQAVESRLQEIIENAVDLSVLSPELNRQGASWPLLYHLSGLRANLLRPFGPWLGGEVLEVGAGCGALTRYLGEGGARVLALEGSPRRAALTRARTRDLNNVTVMAERFDQFDGGRKFDAVTLVGVLEYAGLFGQDAKPALAMLARARSRLKPQGRLILAIENQLGLKYLAGAPEDHLGQPMVGIEGRYRDGQPRTYGRAALAHLLTQAGFADLRFYAPFPDYKLPMAIISEAGLRHPEFDAAGLAWQTVRRDPQLPPHCHFSLELAWPQVFANDLALELANSLLIVASLMKRPDPDPPVLAWHYSTERRPEYCKETRFLTAAKGGIVVTCQGLASHPPGPGDGQRIIASCYPPAGAYVAGELLSWQFVQLVSSDGWTMQAVGAFLKRYLAILEALAARRGRALSLTSLEAPLPGEFFDAVPQNIILPPGRAPVLIDQEWRLREDYGFDLAHLLGRALMLLLNQVGGFGPNPGGQAYTHRDFVQAAFGAAGFPLSDQALARLLARELEVLEQVMVNIPALRQFFQEWPHQTLPRRGQGYSQELALREQQIAALSQALALREQDLARMRHSASWRFTRPLRALKRLFLGGQGR